MTVRPNPTWLPIRGALLPGTLAAAIACLAGLGTLSSRSAAADAAPAIAPRPAPDASRGPEVHIVLSYHDEYAWQGRMLDEMRATIDDRAEIVVHRLDSLRHKAPDEIARRLDAIAVKLRDAEPAAVITADDHASRGIMERLADTTIPVAFCGVNWPGKPFDRPDNTSGMLEVPTIHRLMEVIRDLRPTIRHVTVLSGARLTDRTEATAILKQAASLGLSGTHLEAEDFEQWTAGYRDVDDRTLLVCLNNAGIIGFDDEAAAALAVEGSPAFTASGYPWMNEFVALTAVKSPEEHGAWGAELALAAIDGIAMSDVPIVPSTRSIVSVNLEIVTASEIELPRRLMRLAHDD